MCDHSMSGMYTSTKGTLKSPSAVLCPLMEHLSLRDSAVSKSQAHRAAAVGGALKSPSDVLCPLMAQISLRDPTDCKTSRAHRATVGRLNRNAVCKNRQAPEAAAYHRARTRIMNSGRARYRARAAWCCDQTRWCLTIPSHTAEAAVNLRLQVAAAGSRPNKILCWLVSWLTSELRAGRAPTEWDMHVAAEERFLFKI